MSEKRHPNFAKLAAAHILEWTAFNTLDTFGYPQLHEMLKNKENVVNGNRRSLYLEVPEDAFPLIAARHASRVGHLVARYLLLTGGQPVYCTTLTELRYDLVVAPALPRDVELNPKLSAIMGGKGYLVVPSFFGTHASPTEELIQPGQLMEIGDRLASHVYDGGGLVLVGSPMSHPGLQHFGSLVDTFEHYFERVTLRAKDQA